MKRRFKQLWVKGNKPVRWETDFWEKEYNDTDFWTWEKSILSKSEMAKNDMVFYYQEITE